MKYTVRDYLKEYNIMITAGEYILVLSMLDASHNEKIEESIIEESLEIVRGY